MANAKKIFEQLSKKIMKAVTDQKVLEEIGAFGRDRIKTRTRLGYGVAGKGAKREKLKPLSDSYKARRKDMRKAGTLSSMTTPGKSNLTKTGEMLNSVRYQVIGKKVEIYVTGDAAQAKAKANAQMGRPFLNLSDIDLKEMRTKILVQLAKALGK